MNIIPITHINRWLKGEKLSWKALEINRKKEVLGRCSKWQLVQVEKRWCLVFSCMYVSPSCLLLSFSREGFIYHACCQCFSFVFNIRKTDLGLFSTKCLVCSMHYSEKTKGVWDSTVLPQVSSIFITFGSVLVFLFVLEYISSVSDDYHHAIWLSFTICNLKMKLYAIVCWNLSVGAGYFLATQSYLSCSCLLERIVWENVNS